MIISKVMCNELRPTINLHPVVISKSFSKKSRSNASKWVWRISSHAPEPLSPLEITPCLYTKSNSKSLEFLGR